MLQVREPTLMNETFAAGFNRRSLDGLLSLYEADAQFKGEMGGPVHQGLEAIREQLQGLLSLPGTMRAVNNFCIRQGELAILRADWRIQADDGRLIASGSSAELVRRQPDGRWLYVIDHAVGATMPRVD